MPDRGAHKHLQPHRGEFRPPFGGGVCIRKEESALQPAEPVLHASCPYPGRSTGGLWRSLGTIKAKTVYLSQPIVDPHRGMALLFALSFICLQPAVNLMLKPVQFGTVSLYRFWRRCVEVIHVDVLFHRLYVVPRGPCDLGIVYE